jgi:hypothetical protein
LITVLRENDVSVRAGGDRTHIHPPKSGAAYDFFVPDHEFSIEPGSLG